MHGKTRVLVWDAKTEFSKLEGYTAVTDRHQLFYALFQAYKHQKIAYIPPVVSPNEFEFFCKCAFQWIKHRGPGVLIVEELADVTSPFKAFGSWGEICRKVLGLGGDVWAVSQRISESDKTSIGNASDFICFALNRRADRKYMADEMDVSLTQIPRKNHIFIHKNNYSGEVKFSAGFPEEKKKMIKKPNRPADLPAD